MFVTFNTFIKALYDERCSNTIVSAIYRADGGFKASKRNYIKCYGFSEYLAHIRGTKLTAIQTYHVAKMFIVYGKRPAADIPAILGSLIRQYEIDVPAVYGILAKEYWLARFDSPIYE
ncbi:hypothetical protein K5M76_21550 (plasmid) [Shewanella xiamenensis]|uniref:hypothetical protein n=1 Tax=Shewanella TaxID=22 RepID=UPI00217EB66C|nr:MULTISPECIES: hypothetical protein [Shewanella]MCT8858108.1 hypothetical protein [Shewanella xiamenensis]MDH0451001.1 hypothetical protein [Shewanella sp. GD04112]UWG66984.1 hypothetical protein K5M76_21550 [Shewanella xiamenensis]